MACTHPTEPVVTAAGLDRLARSYVATRGTVRLTGRRRRALRRPPRPLPGVPATLGRRLAARLVDLATVLVVVAGVVFLFARGLPAVPGSDVFELSLFLVVLLGYEFLTVAVFGRTLGKWIMDLRVMNVNGYRAAWWSAAARACLPYVLNVVTFGIFGTWCYLSPIMDDGEWRRGWHDRAARTVVVHQP